MSENKNRNKITLNYIQKTNGKITYQFEYSENLKEYFNSNESFFIDYYDININDIPDSILVIPFLCNVLPIAWVLDAIIYLNEVDKVFFKSIDEFKKGYINMYPRINFLGEVNVDELIDNSTKNQDGNNLAFFSGGVDAFNTLINHIDEEPVLLTLWGSDIFFNDTEGWNNVKNHVLKTSERFSVKCRFVKSNFRKIFNEGKLSTFVYEKANDGWWHGFQHGIGLIGHAAPLAYMYSSRIVYIASTFTAKDAGKITCASDPTIDNFVKWASTDIVHDGYEFTRQDKIRNICNFIQEHSNIKINLRICWQSVGGKNCNICEKCYRTTMGILAEKQDPNDYGLLYSCVHNKKMKNDIYYKIKFDHILIPLWEDIQDRFLQVTEIFIQYPELKWITKVNFKKINDDLVRRIMKLNERTRQVVKQIIPFKILILFKNIILHLLLRRGH